MEIKHFPVSKFLDKNKFKRIMQIVALILTVYLIYKLIKFITSGQDEYCRSALCRRSEQHLLNSINFSVNPCENFYEYACGNWKRRHPVYDKISGTNAFHILYLQLRSDLVNYLNQSNKKEEPLALHQAREMYQQCLHEADSNETTNFEEIAYMLNLVNLPIIPTYSTPSPNFTWYMTAALSKKYLDLAFFIEFEIQIDPWNSTLKKLAIGKPQRLLPFTNQPVTEIEHDLRYEQMITADQLRYRYLKNMHKMAFSNINITWSDDSDYLFAKTYELFLNFGARYCQARSKIFSSDGVIARHYSLTELQEITDQIFHYNDERTIKWKRYFELLFEGSNVQLDFNSEDCIIFVPELTYIVEMLHILADTPKYIIQYYMWAEVANGIIPFTKSSLNPPYNELYRAITGTNKPSRKTFCLNSVHEIYQSSIAFYMVLDNSIKKKFEKVSKMFENIRTVYVDKINNARWLDPETKERLTNILNSMQKHVGYPKWMNDVTQYKTYELDDESFLRTMSKLKHERFLDHLATFKRAVSPDEWWNQYVLSVNTFYSRDFGSVVVPAAILNFPFYQLGLKALDYGALGMIIGHEISHAFDSTELKRDNDYNKDKIWSEEAYRMYQERARCFIDSYQEYTLQDVGERVDGLLTLDENLADNEGLRTAYRAYKNHVEKDGGDMLLPNLQLSLDQLFFLSFANTWCESGTLESEYEELLNQHSPRPVRILASLRNSEEFAEAWKCKRGTPMNPHKEKCKLW